VSFGEPFYQLDPETSNKLYIYDGGCGSKDKVLFDMVQEFFFLLLASHLRLE